MSAQQKFLIKIFLSFLIASAIFLFLPEEIYAQNLLSNAGFEVVDGSWLSNNSSRAWFTYSSELYLNGSKAGRVTNTSSSSYGIEQVISAIEPGKKYSFNGYAHSNDTNTSSIRVRLAWYESTDGSGSQISTIDSNVVNPPTYEWKFLSGSADAPLNARSAKLRAILASKTTDVEAIAYFDDLVFEKAESPTPTPTPTPTSPSTPTQTPTPTPTINDYSSIYIFEYMPYPESGDEWVELYNGNDFEVNLNGWYVDDIATGGSAPRGISGTIAARGYRQFYLTSAFLNNDGDDVRFLNGGQTEKDKTSFETSTKGKSWSKDENGDWCQIDPTPNSVNPDCPSSTVNSTPTPTPTPTKSSSPTPTLSGKILASAASTVSTVSAVLGEETASNSATLSGESTDETTTSSSSSSRSVSFLPVLLGLSALSIIAMVVSAFWIQRKKAV